MRAHIIYGGALVFLLVFFIVAAKHEIYIFLRRCS